MIALLAALASAPAGPPAPVASARSPAKQAITHYRAGLGEVTPPACERRPGEITVCGRDDQRSVYRLPLPDERAPRTVIGEARKVSIGDSPARVPPGVGLTLTVPIGKAPGQAAPGRAALQGTGDALGK